AFLASLLQITNYELQMTNGKRPMTNGEWQITKINPSFHQRHASAIHNSPRCSRPRSLSLAHSHQPGRPAPPGRTTPGRTRLLVFSQSLEHRPQPLVPP